jgi:F0F1-type ATP synthase membrane subunit b/b'
MNTNTIIKTGLMAVLVSGMMLSCNKSKESGTVRSKLDQSVESIQDDLTQEITELKNEAEFIIADFNNKAYQIKAEALKSRKNIDEEIKSRIIVIENQVVQLEEKLDDIHNQSKESWSEFSRSMKQELTNMKKNIDSLYRKNSG